MHKIDKPVWGGQQVDRESEDGPVKSRKTICETIARNASNTLPKAVIIILWDNKLEMVITNQVGDTREKLYRFLLQASLPWDKNDYV